MIDADDLDEAIAGALDMPSGDLFAHDRGHPSARAMRRFKGHLRRLLAELPDPLMVRDLRELLEAPQSDPPDEG